MEMDKNEIIKDINENNQIISSAFEKSSLIIKLVYEIKKEKSIKLLGDDFFEQNKRKIKIIFNNKLCNLKDNDMSISNDNILVLKIKLLILNTYKLNFSRMFYDCSLLKNFSIITKGEPKFKNKLIKEHKDNQIDNLNINNSKETNQKLSKEFYFFNKSNDETEKKCETNDIYDFSDYKNKSQNIFGMQKKNDISQHEYVQINQILYQSNNFLYKFSSFDSFLFHINNKNYKLININLFSSMNKMIIKKNTKEGETDNSLKDIYFNLIYYLYISYEGNNKLVTDLSYMFYGCSSLQSISGLSKLNTINVENISHIFQNCSKLEFIRDITHWKINNVLDMSYMFADCSSYYHYQIYLIGIPFILKI